MKNITTTFLLLLFALLKVSGQTAVTELNMRIVLGENAKHVIKIKTGHVIKEIVFDYINGEYLIWEINAQ